jgi:hypothetical protein
MTFNDKIQERLKTLIEEKATEVQRRNSDKVENLRAKLHRIGQIEALLKEVSEEMNVQLQQHDKEIKVKSTIAQRIEDLDKLDINSSDMEVPHRDTIIGIAYQNSKHQARPAYCTIKLDFDLDKNLMKEVYNGRQIETHKTKYIEEESLINLVFKMIEETDW